MASGARASAVTMVAGSDTKLLEQPLIADDVTQLIGKVCGGGRAQGGKGVYEGGSGGQEGERQETR